MPHLISSTIKIHDSLSRSTLTNLGVDPARFMLSVIAHLYVCSQASEMDALCGNPRNKQDLFVGPIRSCEFGLVLVLKSKIAHNPLVGKFAKVYSKLSPLRLLSDSCSRILSAVSYDEQQQGRLGDDV